MASKKLRPAATALLDVSRGVERFTTQDIAGAMNSIRAPSSPHAECVCSLEAGSSLSVRCASVCFSSAKSTD